MIICQSSILFLKSFDFNGKIWIRNISLNILAKANATRRKGTTTTRLKDDC